MLIIIIPEFPVIEVFVHGHWAPWAIVLQPNEEASVKIVADAQWKLKPLRFREGLTRDWGGLESCWKRMNKVFNHNLN